LHQRGTLLPRTGVLNSTIDQYYMSQRCAVCDRLTNSLQQLCTHCRADRATTAYVLAHRLTTAEAQLDHLQQTCFHCIGVTDRAQANACVSLDCPVFFEKTRCANVVEESALLLSRGAKTHE
jgi:DNA polymerase zeta